MTKSIGEVCRIIGGGTPSKKNPHYYEGSIPWASVRDMNVRVIKTTEYSITEEALRKSATNLIPAGEVVISTHVGLGKVCVLGQDTAINQDLKAVIPSDDSLSRWYLYYWFLSKADILVANGKGATVKGVTVDFVKGLKLPIRERHEQDQIVKILDAIHLVIESSELELCKLDQLAKSRFVEMFGDAIWPKTTIGELSEFLTSGSRGWAKYYSDEGELFITIKNVKNTRISFDDVQHIVPPQGAEADRTRVREGDLLISITADLGRTGVVTDEIASRGAYINQHLTRISLKRNVVDPLYAAFYIESPGGKEQIERHNQSAVKAGLNFESIRSIQLPLPPIDKQRQFSAFIEQLDKSEFAIRKRLEKARLLYRAKLQEFFG